jgi:HlyD family secretion protein
MAEHTAKKNGTRIFAIAFVVAMFVAIGFLMTRKTVIPVRAELSRRESILNTISTNGKIEPADNFEAHAPIPAAVKRVLVKEGDHVRAGQLLLALDDGDARAQAAKAAAQIKAAEADVNAVSKGGTHEEVLQNQADLAKARADLNSAERNLIALQKLQQTGAASTGELNEAQNRVKRAQADVQLLEQRQSARYSNPEVQRVQAQAAEARAAYSAAEQAVRSANIVAPRDGVVYSLPVRAGNFVAAGDLLVQVANLEKMQVRTFVDEPEIGKLQPGQKVTVSWDAIPGRVWGGVVSRVPTTVVMHGTRSVGELICAVDNADLKLLPNVNVSVSVITDRQDNAITVSREAVIQDQGKRFIYEVLGNKLKRHEVQTGVSNLTRIQITKGLDENVRVALGAVNAQPLTDGAPVKVVE